MFGEFSNNLKIKSKKKIKNIQIKLNKTDYTKKVKYNKIESSYLRQYKKYFHKKLSIKYNVLPKEYILIQLENFVKAKYCHSLAKFKEDLLYNYEQEFLNKFYNKKDSNKKIPLFSEFYKTYLAFFCRPTLSELNLNELIEEMVERKAKAFYQENYQEEKDEKNSKKIINTIFFTNKVRKDISRKNTLTDLSKTTIDFMTATNKNSLNSFVSINNLVKEIGGGENNKNNNLINRNAMTSRQINNINKNDRISKIIKNLEINSNYKINPNLIKKSNILKNSTKSIIRQKENKENKPLTNKKIKEIKVKSINNTNNSNNKTQMNYSNKNMITHNTEINTNRNRESNNTLSKPLYHKINIVNNKIIIINNNRSKGNILTVSKEKLNFKKNNKTSRNYNTNNFFSTYNNNTIGILDSKDKILNNQNYNTNAYLLKSFKEHYHKKEQSTKNSNSLQPKSYIKLKHIKIIKEKDLNISKQKTSIQSYNNKKMDSNLLANYIDNYKKINNKSNNINNLYNTNIIRKKKLTNYQIFSNNINNINHTQKLSNMSKEKLSPLYKMINSTCSIGAINKNKVNSILKINAYNTLESYPKSKYTNIYRKHCSTQEQYKAKLQINNNSLNKNVLSLKLAKK